MTLQAVITKIFNQRYSLDSLSALAYPTDENIQATLHAHECPNGSTIYRAVLGQCMLPITKTEVDYVPNAIHQDDKGGGNYSLASAASDPPTVPRYRVYTRWVPCDDTEETLCCLHTTRICRNPVTGMNQKTVTATQYGGTVTCPEEGNPDYINPILGAGETAGACLFYCMEGEVTRPERGEGGEGVPSLSNR